MRAVDLIGKKRDGGEHSQAEIAWLVDGYTRGEIPDYQMAAWLMAVVWRGMTPAEATTLTQVMAASGAQLDLHSVAPLTADKHSTGGVGDKTTLIVGPLVAACGLPMGKMSGRGLGFTTGTVDKLESIPGMRTSLSLEAFTRQLREVGLVLATQTADLAPADKKIYALRDVTGTVGSPALIAASVMSKKLAAGADCIVLDVKCGRGAFMATLDEARSLAQLMVQIGQRAGRRMVAVISSMEQPLGNALGHSLEVIEAIETLQDQGPSDLVELSCELTARLLVLAGHAANREGGMYMARASLTDGTAWQKFCQTITAQGGDLNTLDNPSTFARAPVIETIDAPSSGFIHAIDARELAMTINEMGGGRAKAGGDIDLTVGLRLHAKVGDRVEAGAPLLKLHAPGTDIAAQMKARLLAAYHIAPEACTKPPLILEVID